MSAVKVFIRLVVTVSYRLANSYKSICAIFPLKKMIGRGVVAADSCSITKSAELYDARPSFWSRLAACTLLIFVLNKPVPFIITLAFADIAKMYYANIGSQSIGLLALSSQS